MLRGLLAAAGDQGRAVGAFTCYDLAGAEAVVRGAERCAAPAIVLVSPGQLGRDDGERFVRALVALARTLPDRLLVQADHVADPELAERAAEWGVGAVMFDASARPLADNAAATGAVVERCRRQGVAVEAELGRVTGHEDRAGVTLAGAQTEPAEVAGFVERTGVDCLAVAVGNVHGHYHGQPQLDWERLEAIHSVCAVPISLHGASGLPSADLARACRLGVGKVNVNTELRARYLATVREELDARLDALDLDGLRQRVIEDVSDVVTAKLEALGWEQR